MASANTAILQEILARFDGVDSSIQAIRTDITSLRSDVTSLRSDVTSLQSDVTSLRSDVSTIQTDLVVVKKGLADLTHQFNTYTKRESDKQELTDVNRFIHAWENETFIPAYISNFRDFYRPNDDSIFTDLDGCVLIGEPAHAAYITESKHSLTVDDLLKKLSQFCEILNTINTLQTKNHIWLANQSDKFQDMVAKHDLINFPKDIYFMFASDTMTKEMRKYIEKVNSGELERNQLQQVIQFRESDLYKRILESTDIPAWVKLRLEKASSVMDILKTIRPASAHLVDLQNEILLMFPESDPCFKQLQGRLGIISLDIVVWPTGSKALSGFPKGGKRKTLRQKK